MSCWTILGGSGSSEPREKSHMHPSSKSRDGALQGA